MKKGIVLIVFVLFISSASSAQTRQAYNTNIEFGVGKVLYKDFLANDVKKILSESYSYSVGINKVTKYKNLHKLNISYTEEKNKASVLNTRLAYSFEKSLSRGKYGRGFLGLSIGGGGGYEHYDSSFVQKTKLYPFALVGANYEFFITRSFSIFLKTEGCFAFRPIVNNVQNHTNFGVKFKLNKGKSI